MRFGNVDVERIARYTKIELALLGPIRRCIRQKGSKVAVDETRVRGDLFAGLNGSPEAAGIVKAAFEQRTVIVIFGDSHFS